MSNSSFISSAFVDETVSRNLDVKLEDGIACDIVLTYKDETGKELGVYNDESYVENHHISYPFNIEEVANKLKIELEEIDHLIAAVDIDCDGEIATGEEVKLNVIPVLHLFILIAGTSDPINSDNKKESRAQSYDTKLRLDPEAKTLKDKLRIEDYKKEAQNYWDVKFFSQMKELTKQYKNFELFPFHGWTGDNSVNNREVAGAYLVNRLCGAEGETAYYGESYQNRPIHFHLIGHSHGGNVMNEMTKQMDKLGSAWPKKWKVKSMTYLSTPFFNDIHQVKVTDKTFHKDAEVLSLYNDYDLTQRVIADFSMHMLEGIDAILEKKKDLQGKSFKEKLKEVGEDYKAIPTNKLTDLYLTDAEGRFLYEKVVDFLDSLTALITENLYQVLDALNQEIEYELADYFKENFPEDTFSTKRKILDDSAYTELKSMFAEIVQDIAVLRATFFDRVDKPDSSYSRFSFFSDLSKGSALFDTLNRFLDIETNLVSHQPLSLWNVLFKVLNHNIEKYDNTYVKPDKQFSGLPITNIQVRDRDEYDIKTRQAEGASSFTRAMITSQSYGLQSQKTNDILEPKVFSERYYKFIEKMQEREKNYNANPSQTNLMDILFSLLAQSPVHTMIDRWAGIGLFGLEILLNDNAEKSLKSLKVTIDKLKKLFDDRYVGELEAFGMGSLNYFMIESHSTSRRVLHDDVKDFLTRLGGKKA